MAEQVQPIVIKKIKKGGHGHHGGAWKVAYADFVTAMMAFFLLLWLLSSTTPEQKAGLAEFFTPTIGLKDSMGIGFKGGVKQSEPGRSKNDLTEVGLVASSVKQGDAPDAPNAQQGQSDPEAEAAAAAIKSEEVMPEDTEEFKATSQDIKQALDQDKDLKEYQNNIIIQDTPEGLKIDMIDDPQKPMFLPGGAVLTDMGKKVLDSMANMIMKTPNNITINGHTDAGGGTENPLYTNWELSADRANGARRFLSTTQLEPERVMKVVALAGKELLTPQEPNSPRNRRITFILLRGSYFRDPKAMPTTRTLLSVPSATVKKEEPTPEKKTEQPASPTNTGKSIFNPANVPQPPPSSSSAPDTSRGILQ
jgi:chemotaxis protein MotB